MFANVVLSIICVGLVGVLGLIAYGLNCVARRIRSVEVDHQETQAHLQAESAKVTQLLDHAGLAPQPQSLLGFKLPAALAAERMRGMQNAYGKSAGEGASVASSAAPPAAPPPPPPAAAAASVTDATASPAVSAPIAAVPAANFDPMARLIELEQRLAQLARQHGDAARMVESLCSVMHRHGEHFSSLNVGLTGVRRDTREAVRKVAEQLGKAIDTTAGEVNRIRGIVDPPKAVEQEAAA